MIPIFTTALNFIAGGLFLAFAFASSSFEG